MDDETQYISRHLDEEGSVYRDLGDTQPLRSRDYPTDALWQVEDTRVDHEKILRERRRQWLTRMHWPFSRLGTFSVVCITMGITLWIVCAIVLFGHKGDVQREQSALLDEWNATQSTQPTAGPTKKTFKPTPTKTKPTQSIANTLTLNSGNSVAKVTVPRIGMTWIVVEGVSESDIRTSPGHYPGSAMPGQSGNFAVAGHREPGIFWDLDLLRTGDIITVENKAHQVFTYQVTRNFITKPQSWPEVSQTPPGFAQGTKVLTFTTCNPKWDNYERLVIHAVMV